MNDTDLADIHGLIANQICANQSYPCHPRSNRYCSISLKLNPKLAYEVANVCEV